MGTTATPWIFAFPSEFFEYISHRYVFGVKESNRDNENILSLLYDLQNLGQTPFCMTFLISGCKHDTKLISVSILTFPRSEDMKYVGKNHVILTVDLGTQGHTHSLYDFSYLGLYTCYRLDLGVDFNILRSRISENLKAVTWPWWLTLKMEVKHICVWPFVSLVVNIIQTWSFYRF